MTLKELIKKEFQIDLSISGGMGNSINDSIILHRIDIDDCVGAERFILNCLSKIRKYKWKVKNQSRLNHGDKIIDKIEIDTFKPTENEIITKVEQYYFDITEFFGFEIVEEEKFIESETV